MPSARRLALLVACLAAGGAVTAPAGAMPSGVGDAGLRLAQRSPLTIAGRGFVAGERVRVRVDNGGNRALWRLRASRSGSFRATFDGMSLDPCSGMSALATGREGSRASFKRAPRVCPRPLRPHGDASPGGVRSAPAPGGSCGPPEGAQSVLQAGKLPQPACPPN
jgi:hypothetical protein